MIFRKIAILLLGMLGFCASAAAAQSSVTSSDGEWVLENDVLRLKLSFQEGSGISLQEVYNKAANTSLTQGGSLLFTYTGRLLALTPQQATTNFTFRASDAEWVLAGTDVADILLPEAAGNEHLGKQLDIVLRREQMQARLRFKIYDGGSGVHFQTYLKNLTATHDILIENSEVIRLDFPNQAHWLHYFEEGTWKSTQANINEPATGNRGKGVARCFICLYNEGHGWYLAPETNWKTQYGPEVSGSRESPAYEYMHRPVAVSTAWSTTNRRYVTVKTCPESLQLQLRPDEEFEYIGVNMTVFQGDIVDGKMAVEEHLRRRFQYHHTTTSFMINDWDWFTNGNRTTTYFTRTVFPLAKQAGYDMLLIDDGWNNSTADGKGLDNDGLSRDPITSNTPGIPNMTTFARQVKNAGLRLGLWYSNSGGNHNAGNDLADPAVLEAKRQKIESMISLYDLSHQAVDLTQYWQNLDATDYSMPSDNVYRKLVRSRDMMNQIVSKHPQYEVKVTSEVDIFPTQGDRNTELLHIVNNGWLTITGIDKSIDALGNHFGHLPLSAVYVGGEPTTKTDELYALLCARNIKSKTFPTNWDKEGVARMGQLNAWRRSPRIRTLTDGMVRPVWLGEGFNANDATQWKPNVGPYIWMYTTEAKDRALVYATNGGRNLLSAETIRYPLRWLDNAKQYAVEDVTLDDTGVFTYAFVGTFSGEELNRQGLPVNMAQNSSPAKAFWIQEYTHNDLQVLFADQGVQSYTETILPDGSLSIQAEGTPDAEATIIVYAPKKNDAMRLLVSIDSEGKSKTTISNVENNDIPYPGANISSLRFEPEDYQDAVEKSNSQITVSSFFNGNPDSEGGYSSVATMKAVGDYVTYSFPVPVSGNFNFKLNYKLSKSSRGTARFSFVRSDGTEERLGNDIDESTNQTEKMQTIDLGNHSIEAGTLKLRMRLVGGGISGTGKLIGFNYLLLTRK